MSKQVTVVETKSNGYRCGCCGRTWDDEDSVEKVEMRPFEELYAYALMVDPSNEYTLVGLQYYDEFGNGIYGFSSNYGRDYLNVYLSIGGDDFCIQKDETILLTKEEVMKRYEKFLKTKGDDEK